MTHRSDTVDSIDEVEKRTRSYRESGFTLRATLISAIVIFLMGFIWLDIQYQKPFGFGWSLYWVFYDVFVPNAHALLPVLLFIFLLNPLILRLNKRSLLNKKELGIITIMTAIGGVTIGNGFYIVYIWIMTGLYFPGREYPNLYGDFAEQLSGLAFVKDPDALDSFLMGSSTVPWGAWVIPLITWSLFFFAISFLMMCIGIIVRKSWTDITHLQFPIAKVKLAYVSNSVEQDGRPLSKNTLMWIGFTISALYSGLQAFNKIWPGVPYLDHEKLYNLRTMAISNNPIIKTAFFRSYVSIHPIMIGVFWFVGLDILFSIWFADLLRAIVNIPLIQTGKLGLYIGNTYEVERSMELVTFGGMLGLSAIYLWLMRPCIMDVIKRAIGDTTIDDSEEPASYKIVVWGGLLSLLIVFVFYIFILKGSLLWSSIFIFISLALSVALARLRAEGGVGLQFIAMPFGQLITSTLGPGAMTVNDAVALGSLEYMAFARVWSFPAAMLESWKLGDDLKMNRRIVTIAIWSSILIGSLGFLLFIFPSIYKMGMIQNYLQAKQGVSYWIRLIDGSTRTEVPALTHQAFWIIYAFISVIALTFLKNTYVWWPINPVGYVVGYGYFSRWFVEMAGLVWVIKFLVMRYGGYKVYRQLSPIFLGLGIGQLFAGCIYILLLVSRLIGLI